jgi:hypothetical protein
LRAGEGEQGGGEGIARQGPRLLEIGNGSGPVALGKAANRALDRGGAGSIRSQKQPQLQTAAPAVLGAVQTGTAIGTAVHESTRGDRLRTRDRR